MSTAEVGTTLEAALQYARRGWHVFPLHGIRNGACTCRNVACESPGKHPRGDLVENGVKQGSRHFLRESSR